MSIFKIFQPIAAAFAPNYTIKDAFIAASYLVFPWKWNEIKKGDSQNKLEAYFKEYTDSRFAICFDSARSGFYAILKCAGIGENDEVILQAFTTVALPNAIMWCGAKPIFIDIEKETYNMNPTLLEEKINLHTKAIVVQHTFGNPANMDAIMNIAKKHKLFVIEDCAHSLGAEYRGRKTGTFGNAAFFSFGRDKVISSVSGGIVVTNDWNIGNNIMGFRDNLNYSNCSFILKQLLHPIITIFALNLYKFFGIGKFTMFLIGKLGALTKAYSENEKNNLMPDNFPAKMPNSLCDIAIHQFGLLDKFNLHRIKIASLYSHSLKNGALLSLPQTLPQARNIYLWYTILTENKARLISNANKNGVILGDWFPKPVGPSEISLEKSGYRTGSCPVAEKVSSMCVNLPTNKNVSKCDAMKVIDLIN